MCPRAGAEGLLGPPPGQHLGHVGRVGVHHHRRAGPVQADPSWPCLPSSLVASSSRLGGSVGTNRVQTGPAPFGSLIIAAARPPGPENALRLRRKDRCNRRMSEIVRHVLSVLPAFLLACLAV